MHVLSVGAVSAVGLNAARSMAAIRAGIAAFTPLRYRDDEGEPIVGAVVPGSSAELNGAERLRAMLTLAIDDCLRGAKAQRMPLLLAVSEAERPGGNSVDLSEVFAPSRADGIVFDRDSSEVFRGGHTAVFAALGRARDYLQQGGSVCLVCGVDSYLNAATLDWLEGDWRLKKERNSDGVIPGEAAGAVLLSASKPAHRTPFVRVSGLGFADEPAHILSGQPLLGLGLADAARGALSEAGLQMHDIAFRISDATGEQYGFKEQALLVARTLRQRLPTFPLWHHTDSIGDIGAASGVIQIALATAAFRKGYAPGPRAIACTSAVGQSRAAMVIEMVGA